MWDLEARAEMMSPLFQVQANSWKDNREDC